MEIIVSYSAGAAEQISEYVKANLQKKKFLFFLGGPAKKIFKKKIRDIENNNISRFKFSKFKHVVKHCVIGSDMASRFELDHLKLFKNNKFKTIVFLDHWSQYKERFKDKTSYIYPDQIWVSDEYAFKKTKKLFKIPVIQKKNLLLETIKKKYKFLNKEKKHHLFISQPLKEKKNVFTPRLNYDQFKAFNYLYKKKKFFLRDTTIKIKLHPSEKKNNWKNFLKRNYKGKNIDVTENVALEKIFAQSINVYGCASMAMFLSSELGIKTYCCIPPGGKKSSLPRKKIKNI